MNRGHGKSALRPTAHHRNDGCIASDTFVSSLRPLAMAVQMAGAALAGSLAFSPAALAQPAAASGTINADVPAGPLGDALRRFAAQAGVAIAVDADKVRGKSSPGLKGPTGVEDGFRRLLAGSGYQLGRNASGYVLVAQAAAAGTTVLAPVEVTASQIPGELPPAYPGGQLARGGSVGLLGNRDVMETPFSTVNYTSQLMEDQQARTVGDTVINDPSVRLTTGGNGFDDTFQIRGFAVSANDVAFNGMYGLVSSQHVPSQLVERVELLKGPGALVNGIAPTGGSIGGSINVVSKRAGDEPLTRVTTSYLSEANFGTHVDVARRFGENKEWGIRFNGLARDGEASIDDGNARNFLGALALDYRGERLRWSFDGIWQRDDTDNFRPQVSILSTTTAIPAPPDARSNWYPGTTLVQKDKTAASHIEYDLTDSLTAYAAIGYRAGSNDQAFPSSAVAVNAAGNFSVQNNFYDSATETISNTAGARWRFDTAGIGHELTVGYSGYQQELAFAYITGATTTSNIYNPSPLPAITAARTDPRRSSETNQSSVAVADTLSFADDRVLLTLGVRDQYIRVESYNQTTGGLTSKYATSATTPLGGLVIKPWENVSLYANYAEGLSRGSIVGAGFANTGTVLPAYKSKQYEGGVKVDWGKVTTTAALFQVSRPNLITTPANMRLYDGEQRNRGIELSAYGEVMTGLRGFAGVMFLDPKITKTSTAAEKGKDAAGMPDLTFSAGLDWDTPWVRGLALNGRVVYTSGSYLNNTNTLRFDDWTRYDIGARYRTEVGGTPFTLRANVENLFDKTYWLTTGTYVTVGSPRTVVLSASVDF